MADVRQLDMMTVGDLFIKDGYVLDFSNWTFSVFFKEEIGVDIDDPKFAVEGTSKGKRLRYFLRTVDNAVAIKTLKALWEYREMRRERAGEDDKVPNAQVRLQSLLARLGDKSTSAQPTAAVQPDKYDGAIFRNLQTQLIELGKLDPHPRGFAFEKYLKDTFDTFKLEARSPFRLVGEQIDGSFLLADETYLLEAKWQNEQVGANILRAFQGKVEEKTSWTRGLIVSYSGFSQDGLAAFGRGKRVVCLEGADFAEAFTRGIPLPEVLKRKVRRAAETGSPLVRVRDLF